jgi:hypothetical protein
MKRVFLVDVLTCPECGDSRRLLAFILKPSALLRILGHLGQRMAPGLRITPLPVRPLILTIAGPGSRM